jgi:DNA-binding PadR family transcriptional regulator
VYVDILILANLIVRPQHGYELRKHVEQVLGPEVSLNNGMLYPALRRFEEMGAVERTIERQHGKPDRHIYAITLLGRELLHDLLLEFPPEVARNATEFMVRVSFFGELEPAERLELLTAREAMLRRSLEHHEGILQMVSDERVMLPPYAQRVMEFQERQTRDDLAWIDELRKAVAQDQDQE